MARKPEELDSLGFQLWKVVNLWHGQLKKSLAPLRLSPIQHLLLTSVHWHMAQGKIATQAAIARQTGTDVMTTSEIMRKLESRDLIQRERHPQDPRANKVELTEEGQRILGKAREILSVVEQRLFGEERRQELWRREIQRILMQGGDVQ